MSDIGSWYIDYLPIRSRIKKVLGKTGFKFYKDIENKNPAELLDIHGIGPVFCQDLINFKESLQIDVVDFLNKKLEEKGWFLFYVTIEPGPTGSSMVKLKTNPDALEKFERKYQIKVGADFREKTGVVGQVYLWDIEHRIDAENIWAVWQGRISYVFNTLLDDIQSKYQGRILNAG